MIGHPTDHYRAGARIGERSMEHLDSSTYFLGVDRAITSSTTPEQMERERFNFAHHVSHSWIPKKVYGTGYLPFNWLTAGKK